jgi:pyruvate dehydrogenase E2 component (dihydrolipoamide acetyltransferase)
LLFVICYLLLQFERGFMAIVVVLPKQGQTVESCVIAAWKKQKGDSVVEGDVLCEVETDKALLEVTSPTAGTLLEAFFPEGADVPVLTNIAVIGVPGEDVSSFRPDGAAQAEIQAAAAGQLAVAAPEPAAPVVSAIATLPGGRVAISPRARNLAEKKDVDFAALAGTGPGGRIIERDVQAALVAMPKLTPLAKAMTASGDFTAPAQGSGLGGKVTAKDLIPAAVSAPTPVAADEVEVIPLKGVRKVIASRMLESVQTTAQLTLNVSADARAIQAYRQRLKASDEAMGLQKITINDLILLAVARTLPLFPEVNALFTDNTIYRYKNVHLAVAVDTPRGLVVPVMRHAHTLSLKQISEQAKQLANGAVDGSVSPDLLSGGTFTVTNLGSLGIESFTPVLNPPQVAILGVGNINLKPVEVNGEVKFIPHLGLSLTINHQVVDGAPAARFLQTLSQRLAAIDLLLAL